MVLGAGALCLVHGSCLVSLETSGACGLACAPVCMGHMVCLLVPGPPAPGGDAGGRQGGAGPRLQEDPAQVDLHVPGL